MLHFGKDKRHASPLAQLLEQPQGYGPLRLRHCYSGDEREQGYPDLLRLFRRSGDGSKGVEIQKSDSWLFFGQGFIRVEKRENGGSERGLLNRFDLIGDGKVSCGKECGYFRGILFVVDA